MSETFANWRAEKLTRFSPKARFDAGELITQRELVSRQVSEDLTERASTFGLILDDVSLVGRPRCFPTLASSHLMAGFNFIYCIVFFQTHLTFGKEFTEAVEMKQVAQQEAERARFVVEKVPAHVVLHFYFRISVCELCGTKSGLVYVEAAHTTLSSFQAEQQKQAAIISAEGDSQAALLIANSLMEAGDGLVELRKLEAAEEIALQLSRSRNITYLPSGQGTLLQLPQ